jgi:hypothetical protein
VIGSLAEGSPGDDLTGTVAGRSWADSRIIPMLPLLDRRELWEFWHTPPVECDSVSLSYNDLKGRSAIYLSARATGIKQALGYHGRVTCVLGGKNWLLDAVRASTYIQDINSMKFDAVTTPECYVYLTDTENYRWHQLHRAVNHARNLVKANPTSEIIGMAQGTNRTEISFVLKTFRDLGLRWAAYPCGDLLSQRILSPIHEFLSIGREAGLRLWLTGVNSIRIIRRLGADNYSGKKWCYGAAHSLGYVRGALKRVTSLRCDHSYCARNTTLPHDVRLARHNLLCLMNENSQDGWGSYGWS